jgi:hypothetical protein
MRWPPPSAESGRLTPHTTPSRNDVGTGITARPRSRHGRVALRDVHPETGRHDDTLAWLRAEDVYRVLRLDNVRNRAPP